MGIPIFIEDMEENFDNMLEPILMKHFVVVNRRKVLRLGDTDYDFDEDAFKLYITTKVNNPKFLPDIFIRATVINFTVTALGLEE